MPSNSVLKKKNTLLKMENAALQDLRFAVMDDNSRLEREVEEARAWARYWYAKALESRAECTELMTVDETCMLAFGAIWKKIDDARLVVNE